MGETEDYEKSSTPLAHNATHQDGGSDEISVLGLSGALADNQPSSWSLVSGKPSTFAPSAHKTSHQLAGSDALSVAGLSGLLADGQTPLAHKTSHQAGGSDIIDADTLDSLHASAFALAGHNHNGIYSLIGHNHDGVYSLIGHNHSGIYEPIITAGTSAQFWRGDKSWQTLNQAAVDGLKTTDGPTLNHLHLSAPTGIRLEAISSLININYDALIRSITTNQRTILRVMPNGTEPHVPCSLEFFGTDFYADGTNFEQLVLWAKGGADTYYQLFTNASGTGIIRPLQLTTGSNIGIIIDTAGRIGAGKIPTTPLDVNGKIRTDVTLNAGLKIVGHYFTMNINGTDVNVLCE